MSGPTQDWRPGELAVCLTDYEVTGREGLQRVVRGTVYRVLEVEKRDDTVYLNVAKGGGFWLYVLFRKIQPATEDFKNMMRACKPQEKVLQPHE